MQSAFYRFIKKINDRISIKTTFILLFFWSILVLIFRYLLYPLSLDTPKWFPISVLINFKFPLTGIFYLLVFFLLLSIILLNIDKIKEYIIVIAAFLLVFVGNMIQGSFDQAFLQPFYVGINQYYHDALNITNHFEWLATFNQNQANLSVHGSTHPPFAILIHSLFLEIFKGQLPALSISFSFLSLSAIILVLEVLKTIGIDGNKRKYLITLFSILPAINVYGIVCLDGVILTTSTIFLLGLCSFLKNEKKSIGVVLMVIGFALTNLLTYGGLFLLGIGMILSAIDLFRKTRKGVISAMSITIFLFMFILIFIKIIFHYNHILGFINASKIENPQGFRLLADPINYFLTRFEDVSEISFFLSFGVLSVFFSDKLLRLDKDTYTISNWKIISFIGVFVLLIMFISGAYRTGETARACLFIYPYLLLPLSNIDKTKVKTLILFAAIQTAAMQLFLNLFW